MLGLILVPILVGGVSFYFFRTITWKEFLLQLVSCCLFLFGSYKLASCAMLMDTEYLHGRITKKASGTEKCCHCRQVCNSRDKKGNCTSYREVCQHGTDYWWSLRTTVGTIGIRDCSASRRAPKIWKEAKVGEPATVASHYTNYLFADKESLVRHDVVKKFKGQIPAFPGTHTKYKRNSVVSSGPRIPAGWQEEFSEINADMGAKHQVDIVVLLTDARSPEYAQAVEGKWLYGPKNALTFVVSVEGDTIRWARAVTFSKVEDLKVAAREELRGKPLSVLPEVAPALVGMLWKRTPMSDYEYLEKSMTLSTGWMVFLYILAFFVSIAVSIVMHREDVFGDE